MLDSVTVLLASAVPAMLIEAALSCAGAVVVITGAAGSVRSSWKASALDGPLVLLAASVAVAVKL